MPAAKEELAPDALTPQQRPLASSATALDCLRIFVVFLDAWLGRWLYGSPSASPSSARMYTKSQVRQARPSVHGRAILGKAATVDAGPLQISGAPLVLDELRRRPNPIGQLPASHGRHRMVLRSQLRDGFAN